MHTRHYHAVPSLDIVSLQRQTEPLQLAQLNALPFYAPLAPPSPHHLGQFHLELN